MFEQFQRCYRAFEEHNVESPLLESLRLLDLMSGGTLRGADLSLTGQQDADLLDLVEKRKQGVPLEYILGKSTFMGRSFHCSSETLIPTEETALLVSVASRLIREKLKTNPTPIVIEMGTGSGNIAISIALELEDVTILASDVSQGAVEVARRNVEKYGLRQRVPLFRGDLFAPLRELGCEGRTSVVVCNPPYIPTGSLESLDANIADHEPVVALDAGPYGISFFKRLIDESAVMLEPGGILVFEIGLGQHKLVERLLKKTGGDYFQDIELHENHEGIRAISAVRKASAPVENATS